MKMISKHFSYREVTYSKKAEQLGIENEPTDGQLFNAAIVAISILEPAREKLGEPIYINSWFRSKEVNKLVKGSKTSDHMTGCAVDVRTKGNKRNGELFSIIRDLGGFDQLISEFGTDDCPNWIHVSMKSSGNRGEVLRATKGSDGKTHYNRI